MSRWPREPFDSLKSILWECSRATCTYWLTDNIGCHIRRPYKHEETFYEHTDTKQTCFPSCVTGFIWSRLIPTRDSFNKNISRSTLIIHHPTATRAIKWCCSVNESTICSTYLFVNTMPEFSAKHLSSSSYVMDSVLREMLTVKVLLVGKGTIPSSNRKPLESSTFFRSSCVRWNILLIDHIFSI